jgi:phage shock protein PspC (stress-responsive transcriptional regulator)
MKELLQFILHVLFGIATVIGLTGFVIAIYAVIIYVIEHNNSNKC